MRVALLSSLLGVFLMGGSCQEEPPAPYDIMVEASDDNGTPLPEVKIRMGEQMGTTSEEGTLLASIPGTDGMPVEFEINCPSGFRLLDAPKQINLRRIHQIGTKEFAPIVVGVRCTPLMRQAVVLLHLGEVGAGLPYSVNNVPKGETDASGTAHILLEDIASRRFTVEIDTSSDPEIRPLSPSRTFMMPDKDTFFAYELLMSKEAEKKAPTRRRRRSRPRGPSGPTRL